MTSNSPWVKNILPLETVGVVIFPRGKNLIAVIICHLVCGIIIIKAMLCLNEQNKVLFKLLCKANASSRYRSSLVILYCVMKYTKLLFTLMSCSEPMCHNFSVTADLACSIDNHKVVQSLPCWPHIHVLERTPHTGTWMCGLAINWYVLLAWIVIHFWVIIRVKIEEIIVPQNKHTLGIDCFLIWDAPIHECLLTVVPLGNGYSELLYCLVFCRMIKGFVRILISVPWSYHRECLVRNFYILVMSLVDDVWFSPNNMLTSGGT